jgi:hypothetical protein
MLRGWLEPRQLARRETAFEEAERWILLVRDQDGVSGPVARSFPVRKRAREDRTARVDIEIIKGTAFARGILGA